MHEKLHEKVIPHFCRLVDRDPFCTFAFTRCGPMAAPSAANGYMHQLDNGVVHDIPLIGEGERPPP